VRPMRTSARPTILLGVVLAAPAVMSAGCSSEDDSAPVTTARESSSTTTGEAACASTTEATGDQPAGCATLQEVGALQEELNASVSGATDWSVVQRTMEATRPRITDIYDRATAELPELAAQITTVRDLTVEAIDVMVAAPTSAEGRTQVQALPGVADAQAATMEIDAHTTETCGFGFADN
jgi:hypothetical protein